MNVWNVLVSKLGHDITRLIFSYVDGKRPSAGEVWIVGGAAIPTASYDIDVQDLTDQFYYRGRTRGIMFVCADRIFKCGYAGGIGWPRINTKKYLLAGLAVHCKSL